MLRKPAILCSYGKSNSVLLSSHGPSSSSTTGAHSPEPFSHTSKTVSNLTNRRYASVNADPDIPDWPSPRPPGAIPTPYQIFRLRRDEPYSKRRFYELVKLYHPDRHDHEDSTAACGHLPSAVKMERYRLVVAANDILSDPSKRRAYDSCGVGWRESPSIKVRYERPKGESTAQWSGFKGGASAFHNATWEDWERWYGHTYKSNQSLKYFSNERFISLIALASILGAIGHYTQIDHRQTNFLDQVHLKNDAANGQMIRAQESSRGFSSRDQKIHSFLREREASGLIPEDHDSHLRSLPPPDEASRSRAGQHHDGKR